MSTLTFPNRPLSLYDFPGVFPRRNRSFDTETPPAPPLVDYAKKDAGVTTGLLSKAPKPIPVVVDIRTSGPVAPLYSIVSIAAVEVGGSGNSFYALLKPLARSGWDSVAQQSHRFDRRTAEVVGKDPYVAFSDFEKWLKFLGSKPLFFADNPNTWAFVNYYFHQLLGRNPFGTTARDVRAYWLGLSDGVGDKRSFGKVRGGYAHDSVLTTARFTAKALEGIWKVADAAKDRNKRLKAIGAELVKL